MGKIIILILTFLFFKLALFGQQVPLEEDGEYLLFKSDTVIVSYFWDEGKSTFPGAINGTYDIRLRYDLCLNVTNLLSDTISYKYKLCTIESNPVEFRTETNLFYDYNKCAKGDPCIYLNPTNCGEIVDFKFKEFKIKLKSGIVFDLTKYLNSQKQNQYKYLIKPKDKN